MSLFRFSLNYLSSPIEGPSPFTASPAISGTIICEFLVRCFEPSLYPSKQHLSFRVLVPSVGVLHGRNRAGLLEIEYGNVTQFPLDSLPYGGRIGNHDNPLRCVF